MSLRIQGLGTALPEHRMSQSEATELAQQIYCQTPEQSRLMAVLFRKAGVDHRYTVLPHKVALKWLPEDDEQTAGDSGDSANSGEGGNSRNGTTTVATRPTTGTLGPTTAERMHFYEQHAAPLAERAARTALDQAGWTGDEVTHLVTVSCSGFAAPGVDVELMGRLGLAPTTERVNVGFMGCHGAINGLRVARAIATADPTARVLLSAVELCSLHYRFQWDPERCIGNLLFADGAAAIVGSGDSTRPGARHVAATGSCLIPDSADAMTWRIGDHGFEMTLSARVPELISQHLRPWISRWLSGQGLDVADVGWVIHPGGPRILSAVEASLGLERGATRISREILAEHGNMSSPTVLFILERTLQLGDVRPLVMLGFGPGLVAEAALIR
jgi:predicted naringenin-chalcone synthase